MKETHAPRGRAGPRGRGASAPGVAGGPGRRGRHRTGAPGVLGRMRRADQHGPPPRTQPARHARIRLGAVRALDAGDRLGRTRGAGHRGRDERGGGDQHHRVPRLPRPGALARTAPHQAGCGAGDGQPARPQGAAGQGVARPLRLRLPLPARLLARSEPDRARLGQGEGRVAPRRGPDRHGAARGGRPRPRRHHPAGRGGVLPPLRQRPEAGAIGAFVERIRTHSHVIRAACRYASAYLPSGSICWRGVEQPGSSSGS